MLISLQGSSSLKACLTFLYQVSTAVPDITNAVPDIANVVPDITNAVPDIANVVPDITNALPDIANAVPDIANAVPDIANAVPDIANAVPDIANVVPDIANAVPKELLNKKISNYLLWGGRLARPVTKGGQDAHPTRLDNLFIGSPQYNKCGSRYKRVFNRGEKAVRSRLD